jgi:hypothetical protein
MTTSPADLTPFDQVRSTVFRLETRQTYVVASEQDRVRAFLDRRPLPPRNILTSPMIARMATSTLDGVRWTRARLISWPLTDYTRFELVSYQESAVVGLETHVADVDRHPELAALTDDFWLFDGDDPDHAVAMLMDYDTDGRFLGRCVTRDPAVLDRCRDQRDLALLDAVPLHRFLAERAAVICP